MAKPIVRLTTEASLKAAIKTGDLARLYFLYGEELYLTRLYERKIVEAAVGKEPSDLNYVRFNGNPSADALSDYAESLPFFAQYKCIVISDLNAEELDTASLNAYLSILESLPETTVLVISQTGVEVDDEKPKAKLKKILQAVEKHGCICKMNYMSAAQAAAMAEKKAARCGCTLSKENATHIAELCGRSLADISNEMDKLCCYAGNGGEITREAIDALVPRLVDTSIYTLSTELVAGHADKALRILDDLFVQRVEPIPIMAALSGTFVDFYRAKISLKERKSSADAGAAFNYRNRAWVLGKAFSAVSRLSEEYLRDCIEVLYRTNMQLNSSKMDKRTLIERALTEISHLKRA